MLIEVKMIILTSVIREKVAQVASGMPDLILEEINLVHEQNLK